VRRQVGAEGRGVLRAVGVGIGDGGREVRRPSKEGASALASRGGQRRALWLELGGYSFSSYSWVVLGWVSRQSDTVGRQMYQDS
jgi:hypothetical protein